MSESEAFLAAICATPADDLPRLVYADWLEEHDQSNYAEFIRMQCEMARVPHYEKVWAYARRDEAWWIHGKPYYADLPQLPAGLTFVEPYRRGFPYAVRCEHPNLLVKYAELIFRLAPIEKLVLVMNDRFVEAWWHFIRMPAFQRFQALRLEGRYADVALEALQALRLNTNLKELELHGEAYDIEQLIRLADSPFDGDLRRLVLELTDYDLRSEFYRGASIRSHSAQRHKLKSLEFHGNRDELVRIREVLLGSCQETLVEFKSLVPFSNSVLTIFNRGAFPNLRCLEVDSGNVNSDRILECVSTQFELHSFQLRHLGVARREAMTAFAHSPRLTDLRRLGLSQIILGKMFVQELSKSPHLMNLYELNLQSCDLGDETGIALMNSPHLKNLILLNLKGNTFSRPIIAGLQDRFGEAFVL